MTSFATRSVGSSTQADEALQAILREIAVPKAVLIEARDRRDLVLDIAMEHDAARDRYVSGSVAHGTHNKPLEDTDCGVKVNRRYPSLRAYGPDGEGHGPEEFIKAFSEFILPRLRARGYENASVNLDGNRAIKFEFNERVDIDDWGPVDPYVDLIVGLARADGHGLWIPNRRRNGWDAADPEHHTWLMTKRDEKPLRVHRAQILRLAKRAVKRDGLVDGRVRVMCPWNLSALALDSVQEVDSLAEGLRAFFADASDQIAHGLTEDPSPVVQEPIKLPEGVSLEMASRRLAAMSAVVQAALDALSRAGARGELQSLFGDEIEAIKSREAKAIRGAYAKGDAAALGGAVGLPGAQKVTRSHGA